MGVSEATNLVLENVSCKGFPFQANPKKDIIIVLKQALIKNCPILGLVPSSETTLVPDIHLAGVLKKMDSIKKVYNQVNKKKNAPNLTG